MVGACHWLSAAGIPIFELLERADRLVAWKPKVAAHRNLTILKVVRRVADTGFSVRSQPLNRTRHGAELISWQSFRLQVQPLAGENEDIMVQIYPLHPHSPSKNICRFKVMLYPSPNMDWAISASGMFFVGFTFFGSICIFICCRLSVLLFQVCYLIFSSPFYQSSAWQKELSSPVSRTSSFKSWITPGFLFCACRPCSSPTWHFTMNLSIQTFWSWIRRG